MANICELCGQTDGVETEATEISMDVLYVCAECLQDRKPVDVEGSAKSW